MSKSLILAAVASSVFAISGVIAYAATASSSAAPNPAPAPASVAKPVALECAATAGDVSQTLTITNNTKAKLKKGAKVNWAINGKTGTQTLTDKVAVGKTITVTAPPGNGGTCTATYVTK